MMASRTAGLVAGAVVALVAGLASYTHMRQLAAEHGETWLAYLVPLSVDGLLVVASLVIVTARRAGTSTPVLAWLALATGVAASLAANVANAGDDLVSRLVAAWPPLAFAVTFELVLRLVRTGDKQLATDDHQPVSSDDGDVWEDPHPTRVDLPTVEQAAPGDDLVTRARDLVATHGRMGRQRLARELNITEHQARRVLAELSHPVRLVAGGEHQ